MLTDRHRAKVSHGLPLPQLRVLSIGRQQLSTALSFCGGTLDVPFSIRTFEVKAAANHTRLSGEGFDDETVDRFVEFKHEGKNLQRDVLPNISCESALGTRTMILHLGAQDVSLHWRTQWWRTG